MQSNPAGVPFFVDGIERGVTPATLTLAPGPHVLELRRGTPRVIPLTLTAGADVSQYLEFAETPIVEAAAPAPAAMPAPAAAEPATTASGAPLAGWVSARLPFTVEIRENGNLLGTTDADRLMLAAGQHELEFVNERLGYRATRTVQVAAGRVLTVSLQLPKGVINLNASPWAEVFVDGQRVGETPIGNLELPIGPHEDRLPAPAVRRETPRGVGHGRQPRPSQCGDEAMKTLIIAALVVLPAVPAHAQAPAFSSSLPGSAVAVGGDTIQTARDLYASARYDEALSVLNGLASADIAKADERRAIEQYRSLCLLALGRAEEAESAIAAAVRADPFYQPSEADASPRVRATFAEVRQRLLPDLAAARYTEAKQTYDRKDFETAAARFTAVVQLLDDPQMEGRLADLRTLAAGFVELSTAAAKPEPEPEPEPAPAPRPAEPAAAPAPGPVAAPAGASGGAPAGPAPKIYSAEDAAVTPPVTVRQDIPRVPNAIVGLTRSSGMLDIIIDANGRVSEIALRARLHPLYDATLLSAAREWRYKPAQLNGSPVPFRKLIQINVQR